MTVSTPLGVLGGIVWTPWLVDLTGSLSAVPGLGHLASLVVGLLGGIALQAVFGIAKHVPTTMFDRILEADDQLNDHLHTVQRRTDRALTAVNRGVFDDDGTVRDGVATKIEALTQTSAPPKVDPEKVADLETLLNLLDRALERAEDAPNETYARLELETYLEGLDSEVDRLRNE